MMRVLKVDKKWRVILPQSLRRQAGIGHASHLEARASRGVITMRVLTPKKRIEDDPLLRDLRNPLKAKRRLSRKELEKLKDEMWLP
jgi:bifunctional DNA-binding transcriptional regulator/antitoxin component of YhaV-PrlF toxin-antitoxin module